MWSVLWLFTGVGIGVVYSQILEWAIHRYALHGKKMGKKRGHPLSFHFHVHHRVVRQQQFHDPAYDGSIFKWEAGGQEAYSLLKLGIVHLPLLWFAPGFTIGGAIGMMRYYFIHKKSHLDPEWCKEKLPWHYDHHMAPNQDANWGVTVEWVDILMGTRVHYLGTERAEKDAIRRHERAQTPQPV